ncbi:hypothetical protein [Paraferrimonas haliotis]|uniref:hypothetical protein n=1 Tax=Paraferrimonas haliotis TaxID=2013866 RepID=UPI000F7830E6|nr:hypothetical protein [Paraferrimonas haliotis]
MSTSVVGRLVVAIQADSSKLSQAFRKTTSLSVRWSKNIASATKVVAKTIAGMAAGAVLSLAGVNAAFATMASGIDETAKFADRIAIPIEKLQEYQYAAGQAGMAQGQFNTALQRSTRRISEAAIGTGAAQNAMKELGLDAVKLNALSPDKQLAAIADAMEGVSNETDKVRLAAQLFDSEGVAMINVLRGGAGAMEEAAQRAQDLGLVLTRTDAALAEMANDSIDNTVQMLGGLKNMILVGIAPALQMFNEWIVGTVQRLGGFSTILSNVSAWFGSTFRYIVNDILAPALTSIQTFWLSTKRSFYSILEVGTPLLRGIVGIVTTFRDIVSNAIGFVVARINNVLELVGKDTINFEFDPVSVDDVIPPDFATQMAERANEAAQELTLLQEGTVATWGEMTVTAVDNMVENFTAGYEAIQEQAAKSAEARNLAAQVGGKAEERVNKATSKNYKEEILKRVGLNKEGALRTALTNTFQGISEGVKLGFPMGIPAVAWATLQGFAAYNSIKSIKGIAHSGLPRVPSEGTYLLQKDEAVLKKQEAQEYRAGNLQKTQSNDVTINITATDAEGVRDLLLNERTLIRDLAMEF